MVLFHLVLLLFYLAAFVEFRNRNAPSINILSLCGGANGTLSNRTHRHTHLNRYVSSTCSMPMNCMQFRYNFVVAIGICQLLHWRCGRRRCYRLLLVFRLFVRSFFSLSFSFQFYGWILFRLILCIRFDV